MEVASSNPVQFFFQLILRSSSTSRACRSPPTSRRPRPGLRLPAASEAAKCPTPATLTAEAELSSNRFESCPFESGNRMKTGSNRDQNRIKSYWDFFQTEIDLKCCCLVSSLKSNYFLKSFVKHEPRLSKSWTLQSSVDSNCQSPCCHLGIQGHGAKPLAAPTFQSIHFHF